jgi:signal transduction histidine kinase
VISPLVLRLTAPLVAVSLLLLGVGVGAARYVDQMQRNVSQSLRFNVSSMRAAEEIEILMRDILRTQFDRFLMPGNPALPHLDPTFRQEVHRWLGVAERFSISSEEKELTARARRGYLDLLKETDQLSAELPREELEARVRKLIDVIVQEIVQPIHAYLDFNEEEVEQSVAENQQLADRLVYVLLLLGICGCVAGLVAGFGIARGVTRSLIQLSVPIRAAAGQLETLVGPFTLPVLSRAQQAATDFRQLEGVLRLIAERISAVVERLRQSEREVLRAEQLAAVGQMAAGMAHELRNPLTSMKLLVQGALAQEPDEGIGEPTSRNLSGHDLRILEDEIRRVEGLLQSFLQFARPPRLERREADLNRLVEQTVGLVTGRAAEQQVRIECELPDPPLVSAVDPGQFRQVLLNLLLNALDAAAACCATPRQGVVRVVLLREEGGPLRLEVIDNGCGLPPEIEGRLFTPFATTKETGLGLGLSICKRIVEAHGGSIRGATRLEGGAVFTVQLPEEKDEG